MFKELAYIGLGGAMMLKERVEDELKSLEEKGKISKEDAKNFIENIKEKGKEEEERFKKVLKELLDELGVATKADIEELKQKLS